jgi:DNA-binding MarR family transcriptional regulator
MALFLLGRRLMQIAEMALPKGTATSVRLVFADVAYHPNSSITQITERTGFPQSLVSTAVAKLREHGVLETNADPLDRRPTPALDAVVERLAPPSVEDFLANELALEDQEQVPAALAALDLLARLLIPEVFADGTGTSQRTD